METTVYLGNSNIRCALGNSTSEVFEHIMQGESNIKDGFAFLPKRYASIEDLVIPCIEQVLNGSDISLKNSNTLLVISTTKGNVHLLENGLQDDCFPGVTARKIAAYFNAVNEPIVISNACISGVSALIIAQRLITGGQYANIVVVGVDLLSPFIIEGFRSFKSLSQQRCRPYDITRCGLNLGEGCGVVLLTDDFKHAITPSVAVLGGSISNDANHISGSSRTGDGLFYAIDKAVRRSGLLLQDIDFINMHGTSTVYNDEMESKAVHWAELDDKPLNSLKPYFGHTLGAAGVIETILTAEQMRQNVIFGTPGYNENGVPFALNISARHRQANMRYALKTASGFGGCNAALVLMRSESDRCNSHSERTKWTFANIKPAVIHKANNPALQSGGTSSKTFTDVIRSRYHALGTPNIKFFKMDNLAKLGYVTAAELFAEAGAELQNLKPTETGIVLSNHSASLDTDIRHQQNTAAGEPSPAVFVYTLPNVAMGEICITHHIKGENTFFIDMPPALLEKYARSLIENGELKAVIYGEMELLGEKYHAELNLITACR